MEKIIYREIPIKITFSVTTGYQQTWGEPGCPAEIEDIDYDMAQVLAAVNEEIYGKKSTIDEELMEAAKEAGRNYEMDKADYKYHEMKERGDI